jgi:hypothetical protein
MRPRRQTGCLASLNDFAGRIDHGGILAHGNDRPAGPRTIESFKVALRQISAAFTTLEKARLVAKLNALGAASAAAAGAGKSPEHSDTDPCCSCSARSHGFLSLEKSVENRRWHAHAVVGIIAML